MISTQAMNVELIDVNLARAGLELQKDGKD
jgi:hypothetical protein